MVMMRGVLNVKFRNCIKAELRATGDHPFFLWFPIDVLELIAEYRTVRRDSSWETVGWESVGFVGVKTVAGEV